MRSCSKDQHFIRLFSTGEDPVVRVQAGDVRRRLEHYYADINVKSNILIQIPLGSYVPIFTKKSSEGIELSCPTVSPATSLDMEEQSVAPDSDSCSSPSKTIQPRIGDGVSRGGSIVSPSSSHGGQMEVGQESQARYGEKATLWASGKRFWMIVFLLGSLTVASSLAVFHHRSQAKSAPKLFWVPVYTLAKPLLLCLPRPMVYKPSGRLFDQYEKSHPDVTLSREARQDRILPLDPAYSIRWGDMVPVRSSGPGIGGVVAAINISRILTEQNIRFELRFGEEATYSEMRDSPVVIIGGMNTDWATQLTSGSAFSFDENIAAPNIHEIGGRKRIWKMETVGSHPSKDYGLITRQLSGKTGRFFVQVAGISHFSTEAASELLFDQQELARALRSESISLLDKNLQIVVSTDVTNERSEPPHVVAVSSW